MNKFTTKLGTTYVIRPVCYADLHALHELYHQPEIQPWLPSSFTTGKIMGTAWILKELMKQSHHPHGIFLAITDDSDTLIGACALEAPVFDHRRFEIAFELHPKYHRQGIMKMALPYLINIAFNDYNANRLDAYTLTDNIASQALLKSIGFTQEGIMRQYRMFRNKFCDVMILGLTHDMWQTK